MQNITDSEFQREVEALKSHRRLSVNRPILDPDLPDLAAVRGGGQEILGGAPQGNRVGVDLSDDGAVPQGAASSKGSAQDPALSSGRAKFNARRRGLGEGAGGAQAPQAKTAARPPDDEERTGPEDPSHLFWVPAHMHPEISPSDFRNFLKDHASRAVGQISPPASEAGESPQAGTGAFPFADRVTAMRNEVTETPPPSPSDSLISKSTSLTRKGSMLSRQYRPEQHADDSEDDKPITPLRRNRSILSGGPTLTIDDLQKLEQLAEEASRSQDPSRLRSVLRRTLSLNVAPSGKSPSSPASLWVQVSGIRYTRIYAVTERTCPLTPQP